VAERALRVQQIVPEPVDVFPIRRQRLDEVSVDRMPFPLQLLQLV
jgi:hypothetical protein